jgi:hypothetical protein
MQKTLLKLMMIWPTAILPLAGANTGNCHLDVPLQWTISSTYVDGVTPNLVISDGGGSYVDGQSGIQATIKVCDGTNDAVMEFNSTVRSFSVLFTKPLATNSSTPRWASGSVSGQGVLNIRNIAFVPPGYTRAEEYVFTTRMGARVPVKGTWNFRMWNANNQASPTSGMELTEANTPYTASLVYAHHCPANSAATTGPCVGIVHETWFVYADTTGTGVSSQTGLPLTQVGGLQDSQTPTPVNAGQFSMPFAFVISTIQ